MRCVNLQGTSGCYHLMKCEYFAGQSSPWDAFLEMERG